MPAFYDLKTHVDYLVPSDKKNLDEKGSIYVLAISKSDLNNKSATSEIISTYYKNEVFQGNIKTKLKKIVGNILLRPEYFDLNICVLINLKRKIFLISKADISVDLIRNGNSTSLIKPSKEIVFISGPVNAGDQIKLDNLLTLQIQESDYKKEEKKVNPVFIKKNNFYIAYSQEKKTTLTAGVILLTLLIISVVFGINQKKKNDLENVYGAKLENAILDFNQSEEIFSLDKEKSRELFISASQKLDEVISSGYKNSKIQDLENKISNKKGEILGEYKSEVKDFLDLTLQIADFNAFEISSSSETMFVLDKDKKQIISVELENKKAKIEAGSDDVEDAFNIASYEDRFFVLRKDGIFELTQNEKNVVEENMENSLFHVYSGNIYVVDKFNNKIYRYPGNPLSEKEFGEKTEWLAPGIEADFSKVIDMTIDGSIWLLSSSGKVVKFTMGNPQSIFLKGIPTQLNDPKAIYTNEELTNVYILEPSKKRIVVLDKKGDFVVQYVSDDIANAIDLVVSEKEEKIILLTPQKLKYIELKD